MRERPPRLARQPHVAKPIRTDTVRYPGLDPALLAPDEVAPEAERVEDSGDQPRLAPVRDAGFTLGDTRKDRARRKRNRTRTQRLIGAVIIAAFLVIASLGAASKVASAVRTGERRAVLASTPVAAAAARPITPAQQQAALEQAAPREAMKPQPSPVFAAFRGLQICLPVAASSLTELGFHQASYSYAFRLSTFLKDASLSKAINKHGTGRTPTTNEKDGKLTGRVLRMWRSGRPGRPDTAVDVGALAGTPILAPVTGSVVRVKAYQLYGRYHDVQVHIVPDGYENVDVVLIHLDDVVVNAGDRVEAGVSPVGRVRRLSNQMMLDLGNYTVGPGDHTHLQLNNINDPSYKGLQNE